MIYAIAGLLFFGIFYSIRKFPVPLSSSKNGGATQKTDLALRMAGIWLSLAIYANFGYSIFEEHGMNYFTAMATVTAGWFVPKIVLDYAVWRVSRQWAVHLARHFSWLVFLLLFFALPDMVPIWQTPLQWVYMVSGIGLWLLIYLRLLHKPWLWN